MSRPNQKRQIFEVWSVLGIEAARLLGNSVLLLTNEQKHSQDLPKLLLGSLDSFVRSDL